MANEEHLEILAQGVQRWNQWRKMNPDVIPDLSGAILSEKEYTNEDPSARPMGINFDRANLFKAKIRDSYFFDSYMRYADLRGADLCGSELSHSNLIGANFSDSSCGGTIFQDSFMYECVFSKAHLWRTIFTGASLADSDFSGASIDGSIFGDNDLSQVKNLNRATHHGPSVLGVDCLYASKGAIPEEFLRGCGVPESLVIHIPSLVGAESGFQFYSCFISYSSKDEAFARRLHGRMRDSQLRVWFAPEDIQGGRKLHEQIETAIRIYDKLLVVLSEASLQSEWVITELRKARRAERQTGTRKLFPVRLIDFSALQDWECFDADSGKDLAVELREYFIPDFSNWKNHDSFEEAFTRLLNDLRADSKSSPSLRSDRTK